MATPPVGAVTPGALPGATAATAARVAAAFAAALVCLLAILLPASPASAHAVLSRTNPASGTILAAAPAEIVLTFSESVSAVPGRIQVLGPDGKRADRDAPIVRGTVVSIPMRVDAERGTYLVNYRVVSADSHPVAGGFTYSVGAPSAAPTSTGTGSTTDPVVRKAVPIVKYLGYLGLVLIAGPVLVLLALWPKRLSRRGPIRLALFGFGLAGLSTVLGLVLQAPYTTGSTLLGITMADLRSVIGSTFGSVHIVRTGILVAAAFMVGPLLAGKGGAADRTLLAVLGVAGIATWPLAGHPAASPVPIVSVITDAAHLASMAVWVGGLVMLFGYLLRRANRDELDAILPIWSRWAGLAIAVLFLAGVLSALVEVRTLTALVSTTYGRVIIAKVVLFAAILAVASFSRRLVRSRHAPDEPGRLRRLIGVEIGTAAVVLALAASLVQTTPARTDEANENLAARQPYSAMLTAKLYTLQVEVDPAAAGNNSIHLYAYDAAGKPIPVVEWRGTAALPSAGVEPMDIPLLRITDNHAIGEVALPTAGAWEFRFTLRLSEIDQSTVSTTVQIR